MKSVSRLLTNGPGLARHFLRDRHGLAAVEFAFILPLMLVLFFGTVEFSQGIAVDRKVTLVARALSDLTSKTATAIDDPSLQGIFNASGAILYPYAATTAKATLSEIYVDSNLVAKVQWSKAATYSGMQATLTASSRRAGDVVTGIVPSQLLVKQTYLIFSEVSYQYTPTIGYVMSKAGITLSDVAYTRPRQSVCVTYNSLPTGNCPTP